MLFIVRSKKETGVGRTGIVSARTVLFFSLLLLFHRKEKGKKGTCEGMSEELLNPSTEEMHNYFMGLKELWPQVKISKKGGSGLVLQKHPRLSVSVSQTQTTATLPTPQLNFPSCSDHRSLSASIRWTTDWRQACLPVCSRPFRAVTFHSLCGGF